jgi:hypothetical protein
MMAIRNVALLLGVLAIQTVSAQVAVSGQDPNVPARVSAADAVTLGTTRQEVLARMTETAQSVLADTVSVQTDADPFLCAIVVVQGPADSFDIRFGVFNVAPASLDFLMMDSFRALKGQSLVHQSVFDTAAPAGGSLTVHYPANGDGHNGVVLGFKNFTEFSSAAFSTDPDTYDDPNFGATVRDLNRTVIEVVYTGGLRCRGTLQFDKARNASIAQLMQVYP